MRHIARRVSMTGVRRAATASGGARVSLAPLGLAMAATSVLAVTLAPATAARATPAAAAIPALTGPAMTGPETAGLEIAGLETAGLEIAGLETAGLETAGLETAGLGNAGPAAAVANGEAVPDGGYAFVARLELFGTPEQRRSSPSSVCSGALIAPEWVVTAGHCFLDGGRRYSGRPTTAPTATIGRTELSADGGHRVQIVEVHQSPANDVALARLAEPVRDVPPIQPNTSAPQAGQVLRLAGWGMTGAKPAGLTQRMQTGQVRVSGVTEITVGVSGYAPAATTGACLSDSGAPYFLERPGGQPLLVSVESDGPACPHSSEETTSRIDVLADWLAATMAGRAASASAHLPTRSAAGGPSHGRWAIGGLAVLALAAGGGLVAGARRRGRRR